MLGCFHQFSQGSIQWTVLLVFIYKIVVFFRYLRVTVFLWNEFLERKKEKKKKRETRKNKQDCPKMANDRVSPPTKTRSPSAYIDPCSSSRMQTDIVNCIRSLLTNLSQYELCALITAVCSVNKCVASFWYCQFGEKKNSVKRKYENRKKIFYI